jgi:hypothetical protein
LLITKVLQDPSVLTASTLPLVVDRRIDRKGTVRRTALESMAALYDSLASRFVVECFHFVCVCG